MGGEGRREARGGRQGQVDRVVVMNQGRKVADGTDLRGLAAVRPRIRLRLPRAPRAL